MMIVLSSIMISCDYITVILALCNHYIFFSYGFVTRNTVAAYHGEGSPHNTLRTWLFLADKNIAVLKHQPYSPDISSWDFYFHQEKEGHQGEHQGDPFRKRGGHQGGRNDIAERQARIIPPAVHRKMEKCITRGGIL